MGGKIERVLTGDDGASPCLLHFRLCSGIYFGLGWAYWYVGSGFPRLRWGWYGGLIEISSLVLGCWRRGLHGAVHPP